MQPIHTTDGVVQDVARPDVNKLPKMWDLAKQLCELLGDNIVPVIKVHTDDNIMSTLYIDGSFDLRENWEMGIMRNSRYFSIRISTEKGARYYEPGKKLTLEWMNVGHIKVDGRYKPMTAPRKSTNTPEKIFAKVKQWLLTPQ